MSIPQEKAVIIATEFVRARSRSPHDYPIASKPLDVRLEHGGFPTQSLGAGESYWSVTFEIEAPEDVVLTPDTVIVLVDASTGRPVWFPLM